MKKTSAYVILRITKNEKSIEVTKKGKSYFREDEKSSDPISREISQLRFQELCWYLGFGPKPDTIEEGEEQLGPHEGAYALFDSRVGTKAKILLITWWVLLQFFNIENINECVKTNSTTITHFWISGLQVMSLENVLLSYGLSDDLTSSTHRHVENRLPYLLG